MKVTQETDYPWSGDVKITVEPETPVRFGLNLRIPAWCDAFEVQVNGSVHNPKRAANGYLSIQRQWHAKDTVRLTLAMPIEKVYSHPLVKENLGRFALRRGPLVYCFEDVDNPDGIFQTLSLTDDTALEAAFDSELLGGVTCIHGTGTVFDTSDWGNDLYLRSKPSLKRTDVTAIPYYAWCNRGAGQMAVWVL